MVKHINLKQLVITLVAFTAFMLAGLFIPLNSYTTTYDCLPEVMPTNQRMGFIFGDTIADKERADKAILRASNPPCVNNIKYTLYLL